MPDQIIDICGEPAILSKGPRTWYKWYCNKCHLRGKTTDRKYECHLGMTRITVDYGGGE